LKTLLLLLLFDSPKTRKEINFEFAATIYHETKKCEKQSFGDIFQILDAVLPNYTFKRKKEIFEMVFEGMEKEGRTGSHDAQNKDIQHNDTQQ
jgi:hypothetical protein